MRVRSLKLWGALLLSALPVLATAADYRYVQPDLFRSWLESGRKVVIVDIQSPEEFGKRHIKGSLETNAYPVKSAEEQARLDMALAEITATTADVVIVCPRGGGGAKNTFDYLLKRGVGLERLYILEKGMAGWPYPEQCATGR